MNGWEIFPAFFVFFTLATLAISIPLFPGNTVAAALFSSLGILVSFPTPVLEAAANGLLYGFIIWLVYVSTSGKLEEPEVANNLRRKTRFCSPKGSVNCPVHFGYLSKLPLGGSIPEECYSCPRIEQCLQG